MIRALLLALILAGCGGAVATSTPGEATPPTITGTFTLSDPGGIAIERETGTRYPIRCEGTGGYSDVTEGLDVIVSDQDGRIIGTGRLTQEGMDRESIGTDDLCAFSFSVPVTDPAAFYSIEVGDRGELTYSHADLEGMGWAVEATLGE